MILNVHEIEEDAKSLAYEEPTESLNGLLVHGDVCDFEFHAPAHVQIDYYRAGQELFFHGQVDGTVIGHCGRCLDTYEFPLDTTFAFVLVPAADMAPAELELEKDELDLSVYDGDLIDLTPLVHEQIVLALPTRPLCSDQCRGLCPTCGVNRNVETCQCAGPAGDPRLAILKTLKVGH